MMSSEKEDNSGKSDKHEKGSVISRCLAFIFDGFIVLFITSLISMPFLDSKKIEEMSNEMVNVLQKVNSNEIDEKEYLVDLGNIQYKVARATEIYSIFLILVGSIHYIVIPLYGDGQTIGKRIFKLKIISTDKELSGNQLIIRGFIANGLLFNIIVILLLMFSPKNIYLSLNEQLNIIKYLLCFVSIGTIIFTKDGLSIHDMLAHTKVINYKE